MEEGKNRKKARGTDRRGKLEERPFSFVISKDGKALISRDNRMVTVLAGSEAQKFIRAAASLVGRELQLLMARATGHYRHGNER